MRKLNLEGSRFGRLVVIKNIEPKRTKSGQSIRMWECLCDCGETHIVPTGALTGGNTKSCGCLHKDTHTKHGMSDTRIYDIWTDMKNRCNSPNNPQYKDYGGRGISYDPKWETFEGFYDDMKGGYSENLTLDRIDPNGNYCKENCRWETRSNQGRNRTKLSTNTSGITGVRYSLNKKTGIPYYIAEAKFLENRLSKWFSILEFGEEGAFSLACAEREKFVQELNKLGANFTEFHGKDRTTE